MSTNKKNSLENILRRLNIPEISCNKSKKVFKKDFTVPRYSDYTNLIKYDYKVPQLKMMCTEYGILKKGTKCELINKIYRYLYLSYNIVNIQKLCRRYIVNIYNKAHGPAHKNRKLCVNETDFLSLENLSDIPQTQFFSYKENDGFIYGYDITSLYQYIFKKHNLSNPYTRNEISNDLRIQLKRVIKLSRILNIKIQTKIKEEIISPKKTFELRVSSVFNDIDNLGNYTDYLWFYNLDKMQLIRYIRELYDIWTYRLQLNGDIKHNICPRGSPFRNINLYNILNYDVFFLKKVTLNVMDELINTGIDAEYKSLGAIYVLTALTLVSNDAAAAMPWLYHSVVP